MSLTFNDDKKTVPLSVPLLAWYRRNKRTLPFRENATPYHIWVSEVMLQQTQVATMLPYYERFINTFPTAEALAQGDDETLLKLWQGLGYYNRARNLKKAAVIVTEKWHGILPNDYDELLKLPGIGPYTAGAIMSIAYGAPYVAVDGNVLRVFSRLHAFDGVINQSAAKRKLTDSVRRHQPKDAPGDYNQAVMELGALICLPTAPRCDDCPLKPFCKAQRQGVAETLPNRGKAIKKTTEAVCVILARSPNGFLLQKRGANGLLAGLWQPPLFKGRLLKREAQQKLARLLPGATLGKPLPKASHIFSHKKWNMYGWHAEAPALPPPLPDGFIWATTAEIRDKYAIPSAFNAYKRFLTDDGNALFK